MANKEFGKYTWTYPSKNVKNFKGAVQEYDATDGSKIAIAFTTDGAYVLKDDQGYFGTLDYAGRGGIFSKGMDTITDYNETIQLGSVYISEDGQSVEGADVYDAIDDMPLKDIGYVKTDVKNRMIACGGFGLFDVTSMR